MPQILDVIANENARYKCYELECSFENTDKVGLLEKTLNTSLMAIFIHFLALLASTFRYRVALQVHLLFIAHF